MRAFMQQHSNKKRRAARAAMAPAAAKKQRLKNDNAPRSDNNPARTPGIICRAGWMLKASIWMVPGR